MAGTPKKRVKREYITNLPALIPGPAPEEPVMDRWGRPSDFRREYVDQARVLCEEGMTDKELARFFGVDRSTLYRWQFAHPEFAAAIKLGKEPANDRLERRAYEVAMGYTATIREAVKVKEDGKEVIQIIEKEVEIPPNPDMLRWMLKNRKPDQWKDKTENASTREVIVLTAEQARERLKARLEEMKKLGSGTP